MIMNSYTNWKNHIGNNKSLKSDNLAIKTKEDINDRFFTELEFGTGGLRGKMGLGTNRMNRYIIRRATLGLADTVLKSNRRPKVAIAYDTRNNSKDFALEAALTLASRNITVHLMKEVAPTPSLSFMVRYLKCDAGIVITASHNPKEYNGYKVYGYDGGQITLDMANKILSNMKKHDYFEEINEDLKGFLASKRIQLHDQDIFNAFIKSTLEESLYNSKKKDIKILYTPFNGAGYRYVTYLLDKLGYTYQLVKEQMKPDGNFPTCPKPNPEFKESMDLGMKKMLDLGYDILFATDPDADRCGVAVNQKGKAILLSGDEVGLLLFDFVYHMKKKSHQLSKHPVVVKTIATTDLIYKMAEKYNVKVIDTLTGFKYIGEQLSILTKNKKDKDFLIGIEDSCGYMTSHNVRDKDAINAALLIAEMANYYKNQGLTLIDRLNAIYDEFGHYTTCLRFLTLEGEAGKKKIKKMMKVYRSDKFYKNFLDCNGKYDYLLRKGFGSKKEMKSKLPTSDVIKYYFKDGSELIARPSGTEPKIKFYYLIPSNKKQKAIEAKLL
ncbi:MAG: phospho-sugar mutase [Bacilli bacterium]|nr:phospho-sugar mutase [Bacilli bacterium]